MDFRGAVRGIQARESYNGPTKFTSIPECPWKAVNVSQLPGRACMLAGGESLAEHGGLGGRTGLQITVWAMVQTVCEIRVN